MNQSRSSTTEQLATAGIFLVAIFVLGILSITRWTITAKTISSEEKRRFACCPHVHWQFESIRSFPAGFEMFFNDRFAFRKRLLSSINLLKYRVFAYSSYPKVLVGKNDWLFFLDGGDEETLRHWPPFTQAELMKWVNLFEARRAWLAARNIRYLVFFAPSKCSVYREEVPDGATCLSNKSRMDQLIEALKTSSRVDVVDVRPALIQAKNIGVLYYRTDTHWNRIGALIAYREIAKHLKASFPSIRPVGLDDLQIESYSFGHGDLCGMMGLRDLIPEWNTCAWLKHRRWRFSNNPPTPNLNDEEHQRDPFATELDDPTLPKAICFRDSFMAMPQIFFSDNFRRIAFHWRFDFPIDAIEKEKPDVVIQEFYERGLAREIPSNPPEVDQCARIELFAQRPGDAKLVDAKVAPTN